MHLDRSELTNLQSVITRNASIKNFLLNRSINNITPHTTVVIKTANYETRKDITNQSMDI